MNRYGPVDGLEETVRMRPKVKNVSAEWPWLGLFRGEIKGVVCGAGVIGVEHLAKQNNFERTFISGGNKAELFLIFAYESSNEFLNYVDLR